MFLGEFHLEKHTKFAFDVVDLDGARVFYLFVQDNITESELGSCHFLERIGCIFPCFFAFLCVTSQRERRIIINIFWGRVRRCARSIDSAAALHLPLGWDSWGATTAYSKVYGGKAVAPRPVAAGV